MVNVLRSHAVLLASGQAKWVKTVPLQDRLQKAFFPRFPPRKTVKAWVAARAAEPGAATDRWSELERELRMSLALPARRPEPRAGPFFGAHAARTKTTAT